MNMKYVLQTINNILAKSQNLSIQGAGINNILGEDKIILEYLLFQ